MGFYLQGGDWTLKPSDSQYSPSFGGVGGAGFLYELQAGKKYSETRFLFDLGVGAWGGMTAFIQGSVKTEELLNQLDLQKDDFDYIYEIQNRHDQYNNVAVQVPLMIGLQHNKFYMLVGAKFDASLFTKAHTSATISTYGRYKDFDDFRNMPEYQFFTDQPKVEAPADASLNLNINVCLEMGGRIGVITNAVGYDVPKRKVEYRFAGFIDYGISDIHKSRSLAPFEKAAVYDINPASPNYVYNTRTMLDNSKMNDIMSTNGFASKVNSIMIGVKFTMLFQLPEDKKCVLCKDMYKSLVREGQSGRGVKYEE